MKLSINVPDPKFEIGDFIELDFPTGEQSAHIIARIVNIVMEGDWIYHGLSKLAKMNDDYTADYYLALQEGCTRTNGDPIQPGTMVTQEIEKVDPIAKKIDYDGKVWEHNTPHNLKERWNAWDKEKCQWKPGMEPKG